MAYKKTKEWIEYNKYAKANDKPVLDFAATTLKYKFNKGKVLSYNNFLVDDPKVVIQTKWHNCKPQDLYEFEFYMPDGRLYDYSYFKMKKVYDKYTLGRSLYIRGVFPAKIQGKWKVKIIANNRYVMSKSFTIGNNIKYNKTKTDIKAGVFPFIDDKKMSTWKHGKILPRYISWAILDKYKNVEIIPSIRISKDLANVNIGYEGFKKYIYEDLTLDDSAILDIAKTYSLDYVIVGRVQSYWQNGSSNTKVDIYIIDVEKKQIIDTIHSTGTLNRNDYGIGRPNKVIGLHPNRIKIYNQIYKNLDARIKNIVK